MISGRMAAFVAARGPNCYWCGKPVLTDVPTKHDLAPTRDHLIPLSKKGPHKPRYWSPNLVLAHRICNNNRGSMDAELYRELIEVEEA